MAPRTVALGLASLGLTLSLAVPAPAAVTSSDGQVRVTVTTTQQTVPAPGRLYWTVRITDLTSHPLARLRLGESVAVAGDPGYGGTEPFTSGSCLAGAGTSYCPLPTLVPGQTISRSGSAAVAVRLAPQGPSTIGGQVETEEFVDTPDGTVVSNQAHLAVPIVRAGLPVTGVAASELGTLGICCLIVGAFLGLLGARRLGSRR